MRNLDFAATEERAKGMSVAGLEYSARDCFEAGKVAFELEKAGNRVDKTQGYYMDELSVYRQELARRRG